MTAEDHVRCQESETALETGQLKLKIVHLTFTACAVWLTDISFKVLYVICYILLYNVMYCMLYSFGLMKGANNYDVDSVGHCRTIRQHCTAVKSL